MDVNTFKQQYENYSKRSDYTKLTKYIDNQDGGEMATLDVTVFKKWVNIAISKNAVKKNKQVPQEERFRGISIPLTVALNMFTYLYTAVDELDKEDSSILYPITKIEKVNGKNETVKLGMMYLGRDDKYIHYGLVLPQFKNVKFTFTNDMPGSKGVFSTIKNKDKVDEIISSKVEAKVYFKNVIKFLRECMKEIDTLYNKVYPIKLKPKDTPKEEPKVEVVTSSKDEGFLDSDFDISLD